MLKLTGIEIDLVYDQEMYEMIEAGLRGGMTQTTCRKVEATISIWGMIPIKTKQVATPLRCPQLIRIKHDTKTTPPKKTTI